MIPDEHQREMHECIRELFAHWDPWAGGWCDRLWDAGDLTRERQAQERELVDGDDEWYFEDDEVLEVECT